MAHLDLGFLGRPGPFWIVGFLAALAVGFLAYHRLIAPLSSARRQILRGMRLAALLLILLLILEPVLSVRSHGRGRPRVAVLLDRSSSMLLPAPGGGTRLDEAVGVVRHLLGALGGRFDVRLLGFSSGLDALEPQGLDSLAAFGPTAIGDALEEASVEAPGEVPLGAVILVSDGVATAGKDARLVAKALPVPVHTIAVGDTAELPDVMIREIRAPAEGHVGEPLAIECTLEWRATTPESLRVEAREVFAGSFEVPAAKAVRAEKQLGSLPRGPGREIRVRLDLTPRRPGMNLYAVTLRSAGPDSVAANDTRLVAVEVSERKNRVLYLEGKPDWDFSFLKRAFEADTAFAYTFLVADPVEGFLCYGEQLSEGFPQQPRDLEPFSCIVIGHLSPRDLPSNFVAAIKAFAGRGGGVLLIGGDGSLRGWFDEGLSPLSMDPLGHAERTCTALVPTFDGLSHEVTALEDSPMRIRQLWADLPPVWVPGGRFRQAATARVLLRAADSRPRPVVAVAETGPGRVAAVAARGHWRWDLTAAGAGSEFDWAGREFWRRLIRWLSEGGARERFSVKPARYVFLDGEPISFEARLLDGSARPVAGARIQVSVSRLPHAGEAVGTGPVGTGLAIEPSTRKVIALYPEGEAGRYAGSLEALAPGRYRFEATAEWGAGARRGVQRGEGLFWVDRAGPEMLRTESNWRLLESVARAGGGIFVGASGVDSLLAALPRTVRGRERIWQAEMWNHWAAFGVLLALLATEWIIRRRSGLP